MVPQTYTPDKFLHLPLSGPNIYCTPFVYFQEVGCRVLHGCMSIANPASKALDLTDIHLAILKSNNA